MEICNGCEECGDCENGDCAIHSRCYCALEKQQEAEEQALTRMARKRAMMEKLLPPDIEADNNYEDLDYGI